MAGLRNEDGWFRPADVGALLERLRLPPTNVSQALTDLRGEGSVIRHSRGGSWSVTPEGRGRISELIGELNSAVVQAELESVAGAELGHVWHTTIPYSLAPAKWSGGIRRFLDDNPFEHNVFCMTRFPSREGEDEEEVLDPVRDVIKTIERALDAHGLALHLASRRQIDDDLWGNVAAHMWACQYGIGLFEDRAARGLNYNVVTEVGSMLMTGRRCALLKDSTAPDLPTDFVGQIYKSVDFSDLSAVSESTHLWAARDLGLGTCGECPESTSS